MTPNVSALRQRARELWAWADGYEDTNEAHARRCRVVARDVLDLCNAYEAEHDTRVAMQASYERAITVIQSRRYAQAVARELRDAETTTTLDNPLL